MFVAEMCEIMEEGVGQGRSRGGLSVLTGVLVEDSLFKEATSELAFDGIVTDSSFLA